MVVIGAFRSEEDDYYSMLFLKLDIIVIFSTSFFH